MSTRASSSPVRSARVVRLLSLVVVASLPFAAAARADDSDDSIAGAILERTWNWFNRHGTIGQAETFAPAYLDLVDAAIDRHPRDRRLRLLSARARASMAFAFEHESSPEAATALYRRAATDALAALPDAEALEEVAGRGGRRLRRALAERGVDQVEGLFWFAAAWALRLDLARDDLDTLAELPSVVAILTRVVELDPDHEYGAAHMLLGHHQAMIGRAMGATPEKMKEHYDAAIEAADGDYLLTRVYFARDYAVYTQDSLLFRRTLLDVRMTRSRVLPERALFNRVARRRAGEFLDRIEEFFPDED